MAGRMRCGGRWQGALLMLALAALLAGCALPPLPWQSHSPTPLPDAQQILRTALRLDQIPSEALDPSLAKYRNPGAAQITSLLYSGLFALDARQRPVPALAND